MPFADKFNEAAQNAAIRLIEADEWRGCGWLAKLVEQQVRLTLTTEAVITSSIHNLLPPEETKPGYIRVSEPIDTRDMSEADLENMLTSGRRSDDFSNLSKRSDPVPVDFSNQPAEENNKQQPSDSFESNDFSHVEGYDWRIIVADRLKNHRNSWAEHFVRRPTQEEFENQYRHFEAWTHHVHVNAWVDGEWKTITEEYVPHWSKEKPAETFTTTSDWEDGKQWRIKFWDQRVNRDNFVYFDYKPGGITLHKYHNGKQFAVVEQRPEGI